MKLNFWVFAFIGLLISSTPRAEVYYVDGANGDDSQSGLSTAAAWKTVHKANRLLNPGDTVLIRAGRYEVDAPVVWKGSIEKQGIRPEKNGKAGGPIVYSGYNDEEVSFFGISPRSIAVDLEKRSYIIIKGLHFYDMYKHVWMIEGSYNEIAYCVFQRSRYGVDGNTFWRGSTMYKNSRHNHVHHSTFSHFGDFHNGYDDQGVVFELGNEFGGESESVPEDFTSYNLMEDCHFYAGGHHVVGIHGSYNIIKNNYIHNEEWWQDDEHNRKWGNRVIYMQQYPGKCNMRNLIDGNRIAFGGETKETLDPTMYTAGGNQIKMACRYQIVRRNVFYRCPTMPLYLQVYNRPGRPPDNTFNHIFSNVFYSNGYSANPECSPFNTHAIVIAVAGDTAPCDYTTNNYGHCIKNNIFYRNECKKVPGVPIIGYGKAGAVCSLPSQYYDIADNWEETGDPKWIFDGNPEFLDPSGQRPDFHLREGSPCINAGGYLTAITSATGSGTRFQVKDAGYFMDGWGIEHVQGDEIQLQGGTQRARITKVSYDSNTITVDKAVSWTQGTGIALAYEGPAPDIGAYEYGAIAPMKQAPHSPGNPRCTVHLYSFHGKTVVSFTGDSRTTVAGSVLRVYDLFGRLVAELKPQHGKFVWNTGPVSKGPYLLRLEGTAVHRYQKLFMIR